MSDLPIMSRPRRILLYVVVTAVTYYLFVNYGPWGWPS